MRGAGHFEIPSLGQNPFAVAGLYHPSSILASPVEASERPIRTRSNLAEQKQNQKNDDHDAQAATAVIAGAVEWAAAKTAEPSKQDDDQDNEQNGSDGHEIASKCLCGLVARKSCALRRSLLISSVEEKRQQYDDRDRNAKQPEKNASTHDVLL
jgi:hypothetical protein